MSWTTLVAAALSRRGVSVVYPLARNSRITWWADLQFPYSRNLDTYTDKHTHIYLCVCAYVCVDKSMTRFVIRRIKFSLFIIFKKDSTDDIQLSIAEHQAKGSEMMKKVTWQTAGLRAHVLRVSVSERDLLQTSRNTSAISSGGRRAHCKRLAGPFSRTAPTVIHWCFFFL